MRDLSQRQTSEKGHTHRQSHEAPDRTQRSRPLERVKAPEIVWGDLAQEPECALQLLLQNHVHKELTTYLQAGR